MIRSHSLQSVSQPLIAGLHTDSWFGRLENLWSSILFPKRPSMRVSNRRKKTRSHVPSGLFQRDIRKIDRRLGGRPNWPATNWKGSKQRAVLDGAAKKFGNSSSGMKIAAKRSAGMFSFQDGFSAHLGFQPRRVSQAAS